MENQTIDIWTNDNITFSGIISNYTSTYQTAGYGDTTEQPDR
jgi:hypothetical protein